MPPIYYLNPPPNPFWDFVAGLEDHPMLRGIPRQPPQHEFRAGPAPTPAAAPGATPAQPQPEMSEKAQGKQPTVEDPPEVDPSTVKPEGIRAGGCGRGGRRGFGPRGRGRFAEAFNEDDNKDENKEPNACPKGRRGPRCREGGCRHSERAGGPPFMWGNPFFGPPWAQQGFRGPPPAPAGPPHEQHHRPGPPHEHRHPHGPPHGPPPHFRGHRRPSPPHQRGSFDLGEFLNKLGSRLGIDLSNAAEGLGLAQDRFTAGRTNADVNFEPRSDIFENKDAYTIHLSLPGAKKEDVGVEYEGEHSVLRITGVVHRPEVDEQMMNELVVDGRKRETGVFEKAIRLGTKRDPANIDVAGITAKMADGVLVVRIPKVEKTEQKREVNIDTSSPDRSSETTGQPDYDNDYSEKPVLFDAEEQASVADSEVVGASSKKGPVSLIDQDINEPKTLPERKKTETPVPNESETPSSKAKEAEQTKEEEPAVTEQLPAYSAEHEEDDWERFSDDSGEGEYIKIDVK